jgi:hypothetical protein
MTRSSCAPAASWPAKQFADIPFGDARPAKESFA